VLELRGDNDKDQGYLRKTVVGMLEVREVGLKSNHSSIRSAQQQTVAPKPKENQMFQKGKRLPRQGGRENGVKGGRPTKGEQEVKRLAAELAKKYVEDRPKPVLDTYIALATGKRIGTIRRKIDAATCRHCVERFIPPAPKTISLDLTESAESVYEKIMQDDEAARNQRALDDGRAPDETRDEDETLH